MMPLSELRDGHFEFYRSFWILVVGLNCDGYFAAI